MINHGEILPWHNENTLLVYKNSVYQINHKIMSSVKSFVLWNIVKYYYVGTYLLLIPNILFFLEYR